MLFLRTASGLLSARHIVRIGGLNTRSTGNYHEVEYCVGNEPRETRATEDDVHDFLEDTEQ